MKLLQNLILASSILFSGCTSLTTDKLVAKEEYVKVNSGFFRTPRGGKISTTDKKRPTFNEANLDKEFRTSFELGLKSGPSRLDIGYTPSFRKSSAVLDSDLHTLAKIFKKGEEINFEYDRPTFVLRYSNENLESTLLDDSIKISPSIGFFSQQKYLEIKQGDLDEIRERSRNMFFAGLKLSFQLTDSIYLDSHYDTFLKYGYDSHLGIFYEKEFKDKTSVNFGFSYFWFKEKDSQDEDPTPGSISNEDLEKGIIISLGVEKRF